MSRATNWGELLGRIIVFEGDTRCAIKLNVKGSVKGNVLGMTSGAASGAGVKGASRARQGQFVEGIVWGSVEGTHSARLERIEKDREQ